MTLCNNDNHSPCVICQGISAFGKPVKGVHGSTKTFDLIDEGTKETKADSVTFTRI